MMIDFDREKSLPLPKRRQQKYHAFVINMNGGIEIRKKSGPVREANFDFASLFCSPATEVTPKAAIIIL